MKLHSQITSFHITYCNGNSHTLRVCYGPHKVGLYTTGMFNPTPWAKYTGASGEVPQAHLTTLIKAFRRHLKTPGISTVYDTTYLGTDFIETFHHTINWRAHV